MELGLSQSTDFARRAGGSKHMVDGSVNMKDSSKSEISSERTLYPYVTGTSVIAMKYKDGVIMAFDTAGSYGSTLRYKSVERIKIVGDHTIIDASGEISDFQEIMRYLVELM